MNWKFMHITEEMHCIEPETKILIRGLDNETISCEQTYKQTLISYFCVFPFWLICENPITFAASHSARQLNGFAMFQGWLRTMSKL